MSNASNISLAAVSLPSWERGLKSVHIDLRYTIRCTSLPSWERGLKLRNGTENTLNAIVAPLVGAWIEIISAPTAFEESVVAPLVGAWIEIIGLYSAVNPCHSRSPRGSVD